MQLYSPFTWVWFVFVFGSDAGGVKFGFPEFSLNKLFLFHVILLYKDFKSNINLEL